MADVECLEIHVCKVCGKEHPEPPNKVQSPSRASASCWKCWYPPFHHASIGIVGRLFAQDGQYSPIDGSLGPVLWRWGRGLSAGRSIYIPIYNYLYIYIQYCSATVFVPFGSWQTLGRWISKREQKAASGLIGVRPVRAAFLGRPNVLESRCRFSLAENMIGPFCCCGMCVQCYIFSLSKPVALRPMYQTLFGHIWPCGVQPFPAWLRDGLSKCIR